jgi:hypothetical protein
MKKYSVLSTIMCVTIAVLSFSFFSFTDKKGGDVFEIYLNGKQIHQQFVHADNSTKTLQLSAINANDKIEVFYSHCGLTGKNRVLIVRNEKNELIKEFKFADVNSKRSLMSFYWKDVSKNKAAKLNLYYSSKELPESKLLASLIWNTGSIAKLQ